MAVKNGRQNKLKIEGKTINLDGKRKQNLNSDYVDVAVLVWFLAKEQNVLSLMINESICLWKKLNQ